MPSPTILASINATGRVSTPILIKIRKRGGSGLPVLTKVDLITNKAPKVAVENDTILTCCTAPFNTSSMSVNKEKSGIAIRL